MDWKTYLGDGVYAEFDGFGIILRANDIENPSDTIYIEPLVLDALNVFYSKSIENNIDYGTGNE